MKVLPKPARHVMIIAGEPSGDIHGGSLVKELKKMDPLLKISGIGGPCLKKAGVELFFDIENLTVMGFVEVFFQIKYIRQAFSLFKHHIRTYTPDLLILIDYPGFNLKAAAWAKQKNIPVLYYIGPKVWAWNQSRLLKIKRYVDHAALIFPFEYGIYKKAGIPATYVGNPLLDYIGDFDSQWKRAKDSASVKDHMVVGLLPGSRKNEIKALLIPMLRTAMMLQDRFDHISFVVSAADSINPDFFNKIMEPYRGNKRFSVVYGDPAPIFYKADLLIAASGTVTLEAAVHEIPTIIIYKVFPLTFFLGKHLVQLKFVGLANIIAKKEIMPELLQEDVTPEKICRKAITMLKEDNLRSIKKDLSMIRKLLGGKGAATRTAKIAMSLLY